MTKLWTLRSQDKFLLRLIGKNTVLQITTGNLLKERLVVWREGEVECWTQNCGQGTVRIMFIMRLNCKNLQYIIFWCKAGVSWLIVKCIRSVLSSRLTEVNCLCNRSLVALYATLVVPGAMHCEAELFFLTHKPFFFLTIQWHTDFFSSTTIQWHTVRYIQEKEKVGWHVIDYCHNKKLPKLPLQRI